MKTYNFTVNGKTYTIEAENFQVARAILAQRISAGA
jgi:hypothetical protein